jgi:hypothetical protein
VRFFITFAIAVLLAFQASAQQTIKVGIVGDADNHQVSWTTERGLNYLVEVSPDLVEWMDTGIVAPGTGEIVTYGFSTPTEPKMFYRIRVRPGAVRPGFDDYELIREDDSPSEFSPIGFPINLFGTTWEDCYVNFNGNITFENSLSTYTPDPLQVLGYPIIAPFWADVDTRGDDSQLVTYSHGVELVNGREAFGVNWVKVGYYNSKDDKLNSFQLVLIDRSDTGTGNFDIEFNYDMILWETGDVSGGVDGYGGSPARAGLSNGSNQTIELQHSAQTLLQLDSNPTTGIPNFTTGLIYRNRNSTIPGRFVFQVRSGQVLGALNVNAGPDQSLPSATSATLAGTASNPAGGAVSVLWTVLNGPTGVTISDPTILNPVVTFPADEQITLQLTATSVADPTVTAADTMTINP